MTTVSSGRITIQWVISGDPSFVEQKKILARCKGLFFRCNSGEEVRRFNRMLIDAGMIKGL